MAYKDIWTPVSVVADICEESEFLIGPARPVVLPDAQAFKKRKRPVTIIDEYVVKEKMAKDVELEIRAGRLSSNGQFDASVPPSIFNQLYAMFPKTAEDVKEMHWFKDVGVIDECHDYYYYLTKQELCRYTDDLAGAEDVIEVRDRVRFVCAPGSTTAAADDVKHIIKRNISKADFKAPGLLMDMRVALSVEYHVPDGVYRVAKIVKPHVVRIKRTHTYQYVSRDMPGPTWNYVFSWCWQGATRVEAETKLRFQPDNPTSCELEIECLTPSEYKLAHAFEGHAFVAESMLRKMINLLVFGVTEHENSKFDLLAVQQFIRYQTGRAPMHVVPFRDTLLDLERQELERQDVARQRQLKHVKK